MGVREEGLTKFMINHGSQNLSQSFYHHHHHYYYFVIAYDVFLLYRGSNFSQNFDIIIIYH